MFGAITEKLQSLFSSLAGKKILSEGNISEAVDQVRSALLDADVNYGVVTGFVQRVKEKAIGGSVLKSVTPGQQFIQLVHEELTSLMGSVETPLDLKEKMSVIMLCGLQGSGKTTTAAKLASYIGKTEKQKKILLVACDLQRPAAVEQLKKLGADIGIPVFSVDGETKPLKVAKAAFEKGQKESSNHRNHLDDARRKCKSGRCNFNPRDHEKATQV